MLLFFVLIDHVRGKGMHMSSGVLGIIYLLIASLPAFLVYLYRRQYRDKRLNLVITVMCALLTEWVLCDAIMQCCAMR